MSFVKVVFCGCILILFISEAVQKSSHIWHSYQYGIGRSNREELVVTNVKADERFTYGHNVRNWKSITVGNNVYALGLMNNATTVLNAQLKGNKSFHISNRIIAFNSSPKDFILMEIWDSFLKRPEVVVAFSFLGFDPKLVWFKITEDNDLAEIWGWNLYKDVTHMNHFKFDNQNYLLLITEHNSNINLDLYKFDIGNRKQSDFWLVKSIKLRESIISSAINTFGSDCFISIPQRQQNAVFIYKFSENDLQLYKNLSSSHVDKITSFKIGFRSFLAINGWNAGIFEFTHNDLKRSEIAPVNNIDNTDLWFPIQVKTYRDEVILLLQRSLAHSTHNSFYVEALMFDGTKFVIHDEISCSVYGENENGLACMVDEESDSGLLGSAVLTLADTLAVLVPRSNMMPSGLFMFNTELKDVISPIEAEIENVIAARNKLQKMMDDQQQKLKLIKQRLENSLNTEESNIISAPWKIHTLSSPISENIEELTRTKNSISDPDFEDLEDKLSEIDEKLSVAEQKLNFTIPLTISAHNFKNLIVNGLVEVNGDVLFDNIFTNYLNGQDASGLLNDIVNLRSNRTIEEVKVFKHLDVEQLNFGLMNNISADAILYNDTGAIQIKGDLIFEDELRVEGALIENVNEINMNNELVHSQAIDLPMMNFEHIQVDKLFAENLNKIPLNRQIDNIQDELMDFLKIPYNLTVDNINGENFNEFCHSLCLKNIPRFIPGHTFINGNMNVGNNAHTLTLNDLKFPQEYVTFLTNFTITGKKTFNTLVVSDVVSEGLVNNINTSHTISTSKDQNFTENFVFHDIEVLKNFNKGDAKVFGPHINELLPNPTITETNQLKGNVIFKNLEVDGTIIIDESFNKSNFEQILQDLLYKDEDNQIITSLKEFPNGFTVDNGLNISSNSINNIFLDTFITKDTDQALMFSTINGNITMENLRLNGFYETIDIIELEKIMVKLDGEQYISSTLIFDNNNSEPDITATDFHITKTLNDLKENEYLYTRGDRILDKINVKKIKANEVNVKGQTTGEIVDLNFNEFNSRRMSLNRNQTITSPFTISNSKIHSFQADLINNLPYQKLFNFDVYVKEIQDKLVEGKLKIKAIYTNQSINVQTINNQTVEMHSNTDELKDAIFQGNIHFATIDLKTYNGDNINQFFDNAIFKNETDVKITGNKVFFNDFVVNKLLSPQEINSINVDEILMKRGNQRLLGPLLLIGNITIEEDTEISGMLNDVSLRYLQTAFQKDGDACKIYDDVFFNRILHTENLYVGGHVNNIDIKDFIENIVYLNSENPIISNITFEESVDFESNLQVNGKINNIDLSEFINDVVFTTSDELIEGNVIFTEKVNVSGKLFIDKLEAEYISGIDINDWKTNTLFINQGFVAGKLNFETITVKGSALVDQINNVNLSSLINLKTNEKIDAIFNIQDVGVSSNIDVRNLINGHKLQSEYDNTLMTTSGEIFSNITFLGNVLIRNNLHIVGLTDNKNLSNLVTTSTDQTLTASYNFNSKCILESNLHVKGLLNNQSFTNWSHNVITTKLRENQTINNVWEIEENVVFGTNVIGNGLLGGIDVKNASEEMSERSLSRYTSQKNLIDNYKNACRDVNYIINNAKNQVHKFMYFESMQYLEFKSNIEYVHFFKSHSYLLISETSNCLLYLYRWKRGVFELINQINVGSIAQIVSIHDADFLFFVIKTIKTRLHCKIDGTTFWSFRNDNLEFPQKLDDSILLQESLLPGRFYSLNSNSVIEYLTEDNLVKKYRKWKVTLENAAFIPRGLSTGLSLRNGHQLLRLLRDDPVIEDDFDYNTDVHLMGNVTREANLHLPGRNGGEVIVLNVGAGKNRKTLVAVSSHEETSVKGKLDFIKIFEDIGTGAIFHKVVANNPSSLVAIEFGDSGETLLVFLENQQILQVYEYKGIEGFKHKSAIKLEGSKIITMTLLLESIMEDVFLGIINKNRFNIIRSIMAGNQLEEDNLFCEF